MSPPSSPKALCSLGPSILLLNLLYYLCVNVLHIGAILLANLFLFAS